MLQSCRSAMIAAGIANASDTYPYLFPHHSELIRGQMAMESKRPTKNMAVQRGKSTGAPSDAKATEGRVRNMDVNASVFNLMIGCQ